MTIAQRVEDMLMAAARCSEPGPGVTRLPFTPEHRAVLELLREWMGAAGLSLDMDAAGTLIGRAEGACPGPVLLIGSHQDSVRQGGAYDGMMGVVLPILALQTLKDAGHKPAHPVEVVAFADEEGVRFPTALMGPRALAGTFDMACLDLADRQGVTLGRAMRDFGLDPDAIPELRRNPRSVLGYVETHIEQGPVLQDMDVPLGIVTDICGIERHSLTLTGRAAHAGTTPMALRRDALAGAAEIVLAVERVARDNPGVMATVGAFGIEPNVVNAVPGAAAGTIELRAPDDGVRAAGAADIRAAAEGIAGRRGLELGLERTYAQAAQPCSAALSDRLHAAAGPKTPRLASGATHDASAMADLCPMAMMFTRCRDGISHHPDEYVRPDDMEAAVHALARFLREPASA
ncbi:MAG: M20 family metallo-hydrolase [Hyphomicrobiales bacterium]